MKRGQIMDKETIDHLIKEKVAIKNKMGKCNEYLKEHWLLLIHTLKLIKNSSS